uniref:Peptidase S1 domain-containing protein n=1 Tax=Leptobrachium leishanense TaxID=445787 RepID=A0A8C5MNA1_9ANUR
MHSLFATATFLSTLLALVYGCGMPIIYPKSRVVNGVDAEPHTWPWQVSLQHESRGKYIHMCGGTLINESWVLTAAHCISPCEIYRIVLGEHNLREKEGNEQFIPVKPADIFVHHKWRRIECLECGYDIALIKLNPAAEINDTVQLACLPPAGQIIEDNNNTFYITGWGLLATEGNRPDVLQEALLPIVDHATCTQPKSWGDYVKTNMICAGGDSVSGCQGDSGGPLNYLAENDRWEVHGITSFGPSEGCNVLNKPTVFTRVSAFIDWINKIMNKF